jgi:hypothetical protein
VKDAPAPWHEGQRMGRPPKLTLHQQREAIKRCDRGGESLTEIGRSYNVSAATISRMNRPLKEA